MLTVILLILIIVLLGGGAYGYRTHGMRAVLLALVLVLIILAVIGFVRDEAAVGPGVPSIIDAPKTGAPTPAN